MHTLPLVDGLAVARQARQAGVLGIVRPGDATWGLAACGVVLAEGPDAATFLQSQITSDVDALGVGDTQLSARVERTGHLLDAFAVHRLPDTPSGAARFALLTERERAHVLYEALEGFLFADRLTLTVDLDRVWAVVQGPAAPAVRAGWVASAPEAAWTVERSLTGDPGFVVAVPPIAEPALDGLRELAAEHGVAELGPAALSDVVERLRIEAGWPRVGPDTPKRRLLPETGLEQRTVSWTKGCYLGQEVIARVRTYGSVPNALRALRIDAPLERVPAIGEPVTTAEGRKIGQWASRTVAPAVGEATVALAYLGRNVRTPGQRHELVGADGEPMRAEVLLLPLHAAADRDAAVQQLYDRAIRVFAEGGEGAEDRALALVEQALALDPAFADGYEALGVILGRTGRFHEAIDVFRRLEEVAPDEPMVNTNLSLYYMKIGDKTTAEDQAAKAAAKSMARQRPGASAADVAAEQDAARQQDARRKKQMFEQVLAFDPVDPIALFGAGNAASVLGDWHEAIERLAAARAVDRNNSAVYLALGKAFEQLERTDEALEAYRAGMDVASRRGDLMPLKEMEHRVLLLGR